MKRKMLVLVSLLACSLAAAQPIEGALYDAADARLGPVDGTGHVFARVGDRIVRLRVGPARPGGPNTSPPDFRLLVPMNKGGLMWSGTNCTGAAYIFGTDLSTVGGEVPSVTVITASGRANLYTASPTGGIRSTGWYSYREGEQCSNYEEGLPGFGLKVDSKIDLGTVFVTPYSLR